MKRLFIFIAACAFAVACKPDPQPTPQPQPEPHPEVKVEFKIVSQNPMDFTADGGECIIKYAITNPDESLNVSASMDVDWITETDATYAGQNEIVLVVAKNEGEARTAKVVLTYDKQYEVVVNQEAAPKKPFYMGLKTNMLYDLATIPNLGVEFYLGKNFSIAGNWHYSWWKSDPKAWYWRTYGGDVAIRYWLGKASRIKPLTGHHLGLYGQMITYDFEVGKKGILADKWSWAAGLEYGYSLPIARRLNIDFTLGAGYHWGLFDEYLPIDGHYVWQVTKMRHWMGPTKAEISLVWLLGRGNENEGKGGKR